MKTRTPMMSLANPLSAFVLNMSLAIIQNGPQKQKLSPSLTETCSDKRLLKAHRGFVLLQMIELG